MKICKLKLIEKLSTFVQHGDLLLLYGEIGVGKTLFTKALCEKFDIDNVQSPTFTITNEYVGRLNVLHTDLYRLKAFDITLLEDIYSTAHISIIEWSERFDNDILKMFEHYVKIHIFAPDDENDIQLECFGRFKNLMST